MHEIDTTVPNTTGTPTSSWIEALHVDLVGRLPERRAIARWLAAARRGASHREIAGELLRSEDYCRVQIAKLYRSLLDRDGDPDGLAAWTSLLRSGVALQAVIAGICDSFEYKTNHPGAAPFLESLYERLLNRASDPESRTASLSALQRSSTLSVIRGFLSSCEYCCQRVTELHVRLLGRDPQPAELSEQVVALMQGASLQQVVLGFVTSAAYIARAPARRAELAPADREVASGASAAPRGPDPDADVLALIGDGDIRTALQRLMQRHGAAVYRYCRLALADATLADDIHQQVFIEAFRDLPGFARRSTLQTWLLGIARHRVLDAAKHRRRTRAHLDILTGIDLPDPRRSPGEWIDDAQLEAALVVCVAKLDEPIRHAVLLRYQQGLSYEDMAEICGEKAGTLQARVARALHKLRDLIEARVSRPPPAPAP